MAQARLHQLPSDLRQDISPEPRLKRWGFWTLVLLTALLIHFAAFQIRPAWHPAPAKLPPRVDIQQVDPKKLEAIRRQWKERDRQLLLNKDKSAPKSEEANPDARYMSDRNTKVEKEQRARESQVIPKPGSRTDSDRTTPARTKAPEQQSRARNQTGTRLGNLGVNLGLERPPRPTAPDAGSAPRSERAQRESGGDQAIDDRNLPIGAENLLNTAESIYYSFYARMYEAIGPIWQSRIREVPYQRRVHPGDYSTQVDVVFDAEGNLLDVIHLRDSGIAEFDRAVDSALKAVGKFPNPPKGLLNERGEVHTGWTFTVNVGSGFNLQSLPPERNY